MGAVLFAALALSDPNAVPILHGLVEQGPVALAELSEARRAELQSEISSAFRAGFLTIAAFAAVGVALAWSIPARRL